MNRGAESNGSTAIGISPVQQHIEVCRSLGVPGGRHSSAGPLLAQSARDRADLRGRRKPIIGDLHFRTHVLEERAVRLLRVELSSALGLADAPVGRYPNLSVR